MQALKTTVATAVIVLTLTAVAMAGVQHYTRQNDRAEAQATQPTSTVSLTAAQLKALVGALRDDAADARTTTQRDRRQDQVREHDAARTTTRAHEAAQAGRAPGGTRNGPATCPPNDHERDHERHYDDVTDSDHSDRDHFGDGQHHSGGTDCR